jgi:alkylation response protein AidB-like acyl-CoA dehydrogenase
MEPEARLAAARAWQAKRAEGGYACISWPKEWGGAGGTAMEQVIFAQEEAEFRVPPMREFFEIGLGFCLPTVIKFAPPQQVELFVAPAVRSGASSFPSRRRALTLRGFAPRRCATATNGW